MVLVFNVLYCFMVITYYGFNCFKIQSGEFVVVTDPYTKESSGLTAPRFKADVVLVSRDEPLFNNAEGLGGEPKIFNVPGEYEVGGNFFQGIDLGDGSTAFTWQQEDITLCHLGDFRGKKFPENKLEVLDDIDVLFVPAAHTDIITQIEPRAVIPMQFAISGIKMKMPSIESFSKELGKKAETQEKLTFKKKDLEGSGLKLFVLSAQ